MPFRFDDKLSIPSTRRLQDTGQLICEGAIARVGVLRYNAKDLGSMFADKDPLSVVRVAQLSDDLFSEETLEKFRSAPITIGHPEADVNTKNMKELGKGTLEGKPYQDGLHLAANMVLSDAEAIDLVNSGVHELSVRAYYTLTRVDDNADYDAIRTIQSVNHVAIVERGRAGSTCRISDAAFGHVDEVQVADVLVLSDEDDTKASQKLSDESKDKDGATVLSDEEKLVQAETALSDAQSVIASKDVEISELKAKLDDAVSRITTPEQIEQKVQERITFLNQVAKLSDADFSGKTEGEIKREIVTEMTGIDLKDENDTYVDVRFRILLEDSHEEVTPMSRVLKQVALSDQKQKTPQKSQAELARERMIARYSHNL